MGDYTETCQVVHFNSYKVNVSFTLYNAELEPNRQRQKHVTTKAKNWISKEELRTSYDV
jgi:hypothetical protein